MIHICCLLLIPLADILIPRCLMLSVLRCISGLWWNGMVWDADLMCLKRQSVQNVFLTFWFNWWDGMEWNIIQKQNLYNVSNTSIIHWITVWLFTDNGALLCCCRMFARESSQLQEGQPTFAESSEVIQKHISKGELNVQRFVSSLGRSPRNTNSCLLLPPITHSLP